LAAGASGEHGAAGYVFCAAGHDPIKPPHHKTFQASRLPALKAGSLTIAASICLVKVGNGGDHGFFEHRGGLFIGPLHNTIGSSDVKPCYSG
jgi:hypothetical protein